MELGVTWPLQRLLRISVPYGDPDTSKHLCWDAHCITLRGRSSLLLVHCESRFTCVRYDMTPLDWRNLQEIVPEEIGAALREAGLEEHTVSAYLRALGEPLLTRTHGRREVAFLNRAWEDVLSADLLVDESAQRQPILNAAVNSRPCRCAGAEGIDTAHAHLVRCFQDKE